MTEYTVPNTKLPPISEFGQELSILYVSPDQFSQMHEIIAIYSNLMDKSPTESPTDALALTAKLDRKLTELFGRSDYTNYRVVVRK
jgi:hypothetical protein